MTGRREVLRWMGGGLAGALPLALAWGDKMKKPRIAAVVTEYRENSHADVIVTKFLEGCKTPDGEFRSAVEIASLFMDQVPANDLGKKYAEQHRVPVFSTIEKALTLGGNELAVDGVLLIGEHGNYPHNELGQHLYPRRRFFEEIAAVVRHSGRPVPVFNDKHLAYAWADAKWMYDTARELKIPLLAGSSIPVTWRKPDLHLPVGADLTEGLCVGYGGTEAYGFHALEGLQCMVERRRRGETGVRSVQCVRGEDLWKAADAGCWSWDLLLAALRRSESRELAAATRERVRSQTKDPEAFLVEYADGFRGAVLMLYGLAGEFLFAGRVREQAEPVSTLFWLQDGKPYAHFARLSQAIQTMFTTGRPPYPVERTLLTTGILDAAMHSRFRGGELIRTPHLDIAYRAV